MYVCGAPADPAPKARLGSCRPGARPAVHPFAAAMPVVAITLVSTTTRPRFSWRGGMPACRDIRRRPATGETRIVDLIDRDGGVALRVLRMHDRIIMTGMVPASRRGAMRSALLNHRCGCCRMICRRLSRNEPSYQVEVTVRCIVGLDQLLTAIKRTGPRKHGAEESGQTMRTPVGLRRPQAPQPGARWTPSMAAAGWLRTAASSRDALHGCTTSDRGCGVRRLRLRPSSSTGSARTTNASTRRAGGGVQVATTGC